MAFAYDNYLFYCFTIPLFLVLFFSFTVLPGAIVSLKDIITKGISKERVFSFLFCLFIWLFFIRLGGGRLLNGGVYLLQEKESASITYEGTIKDIYYYSQYSFPNISEYHNLYGDDEIEGIYGSKITVDDLIFKVPESGDLKPGDHVSVVYLPKSRYVLSITEIAKEPAAS